MRIFKKLIPWLIVLVILALLVVFVFIPLYTPEDKSSEMPPEVSFYEGSADPVVMENEFLCFELDPSTTYFTVTDKRSGEVWRSNPQNAASDPIAVTANKEALQSTLIMQYSTDSSTFQINNFKYSIEKGTYALDVQNDCIAVTYSIGKTIEKKYCIPQAITEERYKQFKSAMGGKNAKTVDSNYSKYTLDSITKKGNKDEILAMYPEVENQTLYILKSDLKANAKQKMETCFAAGGYTWEDYELDLQLVAGSQSKSDGVFNITVYYRLDGGDLVVEIPYGEMRYSNGYTINSVTPLPMFGAAGTDEEGFMLVPEGGGALIDFNNGKTTQNAYYANLYGWDYAIARTEAVSETRSDYPVFGVSKGDASFICILEKCDAYAGIQADISGRNSTYNSISAKFNVMHTDRYNVSAKTENMVLISEREMPQDTVTQRYRFLQEGGYVAMAKAYGEYLTDTNADFAAGSVTETPPVCVELVGAIDKTVVTAGLPVDRVLSVTSFDRCGEIMEEMQGAGIRNLSVRVTGWSNGGVNQSVLTSVKVVSAMGGEKGMKSLIKKASAAGVDLYFDGISCFAYDSNLLDGFSPFTDAARHTTRAQVELNPYDVATYQEATYMDAEYYLVRPDYADEMTDNLINFLDEKGAAGVAFRDIGRLLSADYNRKAIYTRQKVEAMNVAAMQRARSKGLKVSIKRGNAYAVPYADLVTNMNFTGTRYSILDEHVPFYQIALHGKVNYTGEAINIASDHVEELLACAEYGAGLSFAFMAEDTLVLQDTLYTGYYAAYYENWRESAAEMAVRYQTEMAGLYSLRITDHCRLDGDVTVTTYEDGTKVYVNHGMLPYEDGAVEVPARDYRVIRGISE